ARRRARAEPAEERDAGGGGAGTLRVVVRAIRSRPREDGGPRPRPPVRPRRPLPGPPRRVRARGDSGGVASRAVLRDCGRNWWRYSEDVGTGILGWRHSVVFRR